MCKMYPLVLKGIYKDYIWGGNRLNKEYGFVSGSQNIAEAWMLSCNNCGSSIILNGELKGKSLNYGIGVFGNDCLGEKAKELPYFPLLIKLIDAKENLSVQVHPANSYALKNENQFGKTEMWYIIDCEKDAKLIYGIKNNITQAELNKVIAEDSITDICNYVPVNKGDVFFIPAGTLHAIGKGILVAEIQQNSNITYRVFDYGRLGTDGKPRPLHKKQASEVISKAPTKATKINPAENTEYGTKQRLAKCEYFTVDLINLNGTAKISNSKSFVSLLVLSGECVMFGNDTSERLIKGSSVFVPANCQVKLQGNAQVIVSSI